MPNYLVCTSSHYYYYFQAGYLDALASTEFVCLSKTVEKFVSECEEVCGRQSHSLRTVLVTHAKRFVERFHEEKKQKLRYW
jgi:vacuolar protein sorting-associated protein 54